MVKRKQSLPLDLDDVDGSGDPRPSYYTFQDCLVEMDIFGYTP